MAIRFGKKTWALVTISTVVALVLWNMIAQMLAVAKVQECLERDWEISFGPRSAASRPAMLPAYLDDKVSDYLSRKYESVAGYGPGPAHTRNRDVVYHERFRALFRGPIREISIYYSEGLRGDLGAALARFPGLRFFCFYDEADVPTGAEWKHLCTWLRRFPELETLEIGGNSITDESIAPLAGHPRLRSITIQQSQLSPECVKIFAMLPNLKKLDVNIEHPDGTTWLTPEGQKAMSEKLPGVSVNAP
jgi:hypothetical protein